MYELPIEPTLIVLFFKSEAGNEPVRDWLKNMPAIDKKTIGTDIKTIQFGFPIGMPLVRKMDANLWKIRSHISNGIARIFFTVDGNFMVLFHGFIKKVNPLQNLIWN
ncbi:type II toxin-antitoxin system RelE/ParE family toxin [Acinetobacter populi]|uniref:type II toxin-antitoxin system RelE/ParE family toxin n=1 Tax=Acinetobacter populi TaxID=1582270 RepID=UPI001FE80B01|nr:type II toxin-antitoxin system RelE/ParE family toxin [Acinetobacter populi]